MISADISTHRDWIFFPFVMYQYVLYVHCFIVLVLSPVVFLPSRTPYSYKYLRVLALWMSNLPSPTESSSRVHSSSGPRCRHCDQRRRACLGLAHCPYGARSSYCEHCHLRCFCATALTKLLLYSADREKLNFAFAIVSRVFSPDICSRVVANSLPFLHR